MNLGKFHVARGIFGDFRPKKHENLPKISKVANFFAPQGRIPRPILVKFARYMRVICLRNVLKVGAIWFINDKFVGTKLISYSPKNISKPPSCETTGRTQKVKEGSKWYGHTLSTCQVWWRSDAAWRRERKKWVFFVCLSCLGPTVCVSLDYRLAHCEGYIVATYTSISMQFSAFLEEKTPCRIF